jgi:toxoflavin synthase
MNSQYDSLAGAYTRLNTERPDRACIMVPTAQKYLGAVSGDVLDLACGSGFYTRQLKAWGARSVLGVDISAEMIRLAEAEDVDGVQYLAADVATMGVLGSFDLAFAGFLLHYAPNVDGLRAMCAGIAANLKSGSRLVAFNENPYFPVHTTEKYSVQARALGPIEDGVVIERTHFRNGKKDFSFRHFHYEPETYAAALRDAGFIDVQWGPFVMGDGAEAGVGKGFWDEYVSGEFSIAVLECVRG